MKVEFELSLDINGKPYIKFRHYDKDNSLDQKALKVFLDAVKENGCVLKNPSGHLESETSNSWELYEIQINESRQSGLSVTQAALDLAFEAGKWEGQVELEEHYDKEQYSQVLVEAINSRKTSLPFDLASAGNTIRVNLRSQVWRDGVRKSAKEYLKKAMLLVRSYCY